MPRSDKPRPRWTSRKFILTVSAQLTSIIILFWPSHENAIVEASASITSLLVILATSLGYVTAEASIDARHAGPAGGPSTDP